MCDIDGCERNGDRVSPQDSSLRICETHYKRWINTGSFEVNRPEGWGEETNRKYKSAECSCCGKTKKIAAKGLCRACYGRLQRTGSLEFKRKGIINTCKADGCDRDVVTHGLCDSHRKKVERYGTLEPLRAGDWGTRTKHPLYIYWTDTKKRETLNICKPWLGEFWDFVKVVHPRPSKNHFLRAIDLEKELGPDNWQWIEGLTNAERHMIKREKQRNHDRSRAKVSIEERTELLNKAGYKCQICGTASSGNDCPVTGTVKTKSLCVDHNHDTGELRGILCRSCNVGLGNFKDNIDLLKKAVQYLERWNNPH